MNTFRNGADRCVLCERLGERDHALAVAADGCGGAAAGAGKRGFGFKLNTNAGTSTSIIGHVTNFVVVSMTERVHATQLPSTYGSERPNGHTRSHVTLVRQLVITARRYALAVGREANSFRDERPAGRPRV